MIDNMTTHTLIHTGCQRTIHLRQQLAHDQLYRIQEIMYQLAPDNMTARDIKSMMEEFMSGSFPSTGETHSRNIEAGAERSSPSPSPGMFRDPQAFVSYAIETYNAGELTAHDLDNLISSLKAWDIPPTGLYVKKTD